MAKDIVTFGGSTAFIDVVSTILCGCGPPVLTFFGKHSTNVVVVVSYKGSGEIRS